ncbi:flagellar motor switch phosphatase FliY [Clostridium sp. Marseille-P299]|uniref:flagellar motor switch phosphatase FliY n=1 Tax=Clostridium sp. Marseille-P299 TaxID=1805477 RepID=UPI00082C0A5F|nr:flagellar motor switch phosphatase FliY [Clostridium sp. Marseille-P299]
MDGMLSQEEINALLNGINAGNDMSSTTALASDSLTDAEKDAIGEISNISMGTAATTLFSLVNQRVNITTPVVTYAKWEDLLDSYDRPCVFIQIYYKEGLDGHNILVLKEKDVKIITDLMMGGDGSNTSGELSELHLSAISEAMNQMMGSAATSISSMLEKRVDISPPNASLVNMSDNINGEDIAPFLKGEFVKVSFRMEIGDLVDSELMQLYPFEFAKDLYKNFVKYSEHEANAASMLTENKQEKPVETVNNSFAPGSVASMTGAVAQQGYIQQNEAPVTHTMPGAQNVNISPVQFQPFMNLGSPLIKSENIDLLLDVPLEVTVELGRTSKSIKEILDFAPGKIIELNRLAGEPIDVLVNGKYVAKGEVVVIEEAFGIRITDIIK